MSLLDAYGEIFPDRCNAQSLGPSVPDPSGGRQDAWTTIGSALPCSVQPAGEAEIMAANALGVKLETKVYLPDDPGDLRSGSRIQVVTLSGLAPARASWLAVQRVAREGLADLIVWRADCTGRP